MGFIAMWRPNTGGDWATDITADQFKQRYHDNKQKGLQLVCLRKMLNDHTFSAVWLPGTGGTPWCYGESVSKFHSLNAERLNDGHRIVDIQLVNPSTGVESDGNIANTHHSKFTAVWRPGSSAEAYAGDKDLHHFTETDAAERAKGLELSCLRLQNDGTFFGVWKSGSGGTWTKPLHFDAFQALDATHTVHGLKLVDIDTINGRDFAGVWHKRTDAIAVAMDSLDAIQKADAVHQKAGMHIFKLFEYHIEPGAAPGGPMGWRLPPM